MQAVAALNAVVYGGEIEGNTIPGMSVLCEGLRQIGAGMHDLKQGAALLAEGGSVEGAELPGMGRAAQGLAAASSGVEVVRGGCEELASGARQLAGGLARMRKEGTSQMATELGNGLLEAEKAQAVLAAMEDRLKGYDSFVGKPEGAIGEVRFLMKIKAAR
jgi:putative membrane protein